MYHYKVRAGRKNAVALLLFSQFQFAANNLTRCVVSKNCFSAPPSSHFLQIIISGKGSSKCFGSRRILRPKQQTDSMNSCNEQVFRGAIALNNIGVDLLEGRCYEQANMTLMDATNAMRSVFHATASAVSACTTRHHPADDVNIKSNSVAVVASMLERANKRRSRPAPVQRRSSFRIQKLHESHQLSFQQQLQPPLLDSTSIYPVRIEDVNDLRNPGSMNHPDVQAAILLHNFGLTNLCLAQVFDKAEARSIKLQQAIYLLQLADDILEQTCSELEDEIDLRQIACVNVAVLTALLQALSWDAQFAELVKSVHDRLVHLGSTIQEIDEVLSWYTCSVHAAAAA